MAMTAVRTLKAKDQAPALVAVPPAATLAERLDEARRAADMPGRRVSELEAAMADALAAADYAAAERIKHELADARMEYGIAAAAVTGLQTAIVETERRQAEDNRVIQEAQAKAEAQRVIGDALAADARAQEQIDARLEQMYQHLEAAKAEYAQALTWQAKSWQERTRVIQARVTLGEIDGPGPRATAPNRADVLKDRDPVVRELAKWAR